MSKNFLGINRVFLVKQALLGVPVFILILVLHFSLVQYNERNLMGNVQSLEQSNLDLITYTLSASFKDFFDILEMIQGTAEFRDFISDQNEGNRDDIEQLFLKICQTNANISKLRYLNLEGMEVLHVENERNITRVLGYDELLDESYREYVSKILKLPEGSIYISELSLTIDEEKIVQPYQPTIRIGMPIFQDSKANGLLIINSNPDFILSFFAKYNPLLSHNITYGLLNGDGRWLIRNDKDDFNSLLLEEETILGDLPNFMNQFSRGDYEAICGNVNTYHIKPLISPTERVYIDDKGGWFVVGFYPKSNITSIGGNIFLRYSNILLLIYLLLYAMWVVENIRRHNKQKDLQYMRITNFIGNYIKDGVVVTDEQNHIIYINTAFKRFSAYNRDDLIGKHYEVLMTYNIFGESCLYNKAETYLLDYVWIKDKHGAYFFAHVLYEQVSSGNKVFQDNYIRIFQNPELPVESLDSLLGGKNTEFYKKIDSGPVRSVQANFQEGPLVCLMVRIGDVRCMSNDVLYNHLKSDYFSDAMIFSYNKSVLLLVFSSDKQSLIEQAIHRLKTYIHDELHESDCNLFSGMSPPIGEPSQIIEGIEQSRLAMQMSENSGSTLLQYSQQQFKTMMEAFTLKQQVLDGISKNEFFLLYQPQVTSRENSIIGAEGLIRWNHPERGLISPNLFIPIFEEDPDLMFHIGRFVIRSAVDFVSEMISKKNLHDREPFNVSINLTAEDLMNPETIQYIKDQLKKKNVPGARLTIEITERSIMEDADAMNTIFSSLREEGVNIAIDDFGKGFSSLDYLRSIHASKIKVDRAFIKDYPNNDDGVIVKAISTMAQALDIGLLTEGIETHAQREFLIQIGCCEYQGFLYSKPIEKSQFIRLYQGEKRSRKDKITRNL